MTMGHFRPFLVLPQTDPYHQNYNQYVISLLTLFKILSFLDTEISQHSCNRTNQFPRFIFIFYSSLKS